MQLKFNKQKTLKEILAQKLLKILVILIIFAAGVYLVEKINFPSPEKKFKIDISNEIIKLK
jgi:hypothetical protein